MSRPLQPLSDADLTELLLDCTTEYRLRLATARGMVAGLTDTVTEMTKAQAALFAAIMGEDDDGDDDND